MKVENRIGFMQGRLSPLIKNKIQSFPIGHWQNEFLISKRLGIRLMEWTINDDKFNQNPIIKNNSWHRIKKLSSNFQVKIKSITADFFMENPVWKLNIKNQIKLIKKFKLLLYSCNKLKIDKIILPLVDNSSIKNKSEEDQLCVFIFKFNTFLKNNRLKILFESDKNPIELNKFINKFPKKNFGINYDTGDSASLGHDSIEQLNLNGKSIFNIHIKDRKYKGNTVPLGEGDFEFDKFFKRLKKTHYRGNFILQTARSKNNEHEKDLKKYYTFLSKLLLK